MGILDMFEPSASTNTAGLLSPQDRLMSLFQGLSQAGMGMSMPGLGKGQALAMGLGGLGQGMAMGNRQALQQQLFLQQLAEKKKQQDAQEEYLKANPHLAGIARAAPAEFFKTLADRATPKQAETPFGFKVNPDGSVSAVPGAFDTMGALEGQKAGARTAAERKAQNQTPLLTDLPEYKGAVAGAQAAAEAYYKAYPVAPGGTLATPFARGAPGMPPTAGLPMVGQDSTNVSRGTLPPGVVYQDPRPAPNTQPGAIEKYLGDRFVQTQEAGIAARNKAQNLDRLGSLLDQAYTGAGGETVLAAQKAAKSLGFDIGNPAPGEAGAALANEMALQLRSPAGGAGMPGAMSDQDREFLKSMTPGLGTTKPGRELMVETMKRLTNRDQEIADFARQYARDHGGRIDLNFEDEVSKRFSGKSMFDDLAARATEAGKPQAAPAPQGAAPQEGQTIVNPRTGERRVMRGGKWVPVP